MKSVHVRITGRVQGVWYRAWTEEQAGERNLSGWVRNRTDGTVEAVFSGAETDVASMLLACEKGPRLARVESVTSMECDAPAPGFTGRPTE